jgi:membrane protein implicated in regulation of membrane protease activity
VELAVPGLSLSAIGIACIAAPFAFLAHRDYVAAGVVFATWLVAPYVLILGYVLLWGAATGNPNPPGSERMGQAIRRVGGVLSRDL